MALQKQKQKPDPEFYLKTTIVPEGGIDLPLVTLPAGTVLFRGQRLPNLANVDPRLFYGDFLGNPEGSQHVCLNPTHNTFFYPLPYIAFGVNDVGQTYDIMNIVILVQPVTVVSMISPSRFVRGTIKRFSGNSPIQRCSTLTQGLCHEQSAKELDALQYDNCLNPEYQMRSTTRGWMAIAELDALTKRQGGTSSMASYIKALESRKPGKGVELVANSYTDSNRNYGFPEIALYPYKNHKGLKSLKRPCKDIKTAIHLMQLEAEADNLNYLPIASITRDGTIDMINGLFTYERLGVSANAFTTPAVNKQPDIEARLAEYLDALQTKGLDLPYYGKGKLSFDTRTGFYVFPQVIPRNQQITEKGETFPYRFLTIPLATVDDRRRALLYTLMFRTLHDAKFMQKYGLEKGFGVKRAMIFDRPPVLTRLFQELGLEIPVAFRDGLGRASRIYKENSAPTVPVPTFAAPAAAPAAASSVAAPVRGISLARKALSEGTNINDIIGGYGKPLNPYGLTREEQEELMREPKVSSTPEGPAPNSPPYRPSTPEGPAPNSPPYRPSTPEGPAPNSPPYRPTSLRGGTRSLKKKTQMTRKVKKTVEHLARAFHKVWAKLGKK